MELQLAVEELRAWCPLVRMGRRADEIRATNPADPRIKQLQKLMQHRDATFNLPLALDVLLAHHWVWPFDARSSGRGVRPPHGGERGAGDVPLGGEHLCARRAAGAAAPLAPRRPRVERRLPAPPVLHSYSPFLAILAVLAMLVFGYIKTHMTAQGGGGSGAAGVGNCGTRAGGSGAVGGGSGIIRGELD